MKLLQIPVPEVSAIAMTISKLETLPQHDRSIRSSALNPRPILRLQAMRAAEMAAMKCGSSVDDLMEKLVRLPLLSHVLLLGTCLL